jgi:uncharacterized membrane protein
MVDLVTALGFEPGRLPKVLFEANLLLLFGLCLTHSLNAHGWKRTLREFGAGFMLTALSESTGVLSGAYVYPGFQFYVWATPVGNPASWVALIYIIMILSDRLVFGRAALDPSAAPLRIGENLFKTIAVLALCDATLALAIDLVLDPLATIYNWWIWVPCEEGVHTIGAGVVDPYNFDHLVWMTTPDNPIAAFFHRFFEGGFRYPTRVLGIPLINFIAWLVFVFVFTSQFRWVESRQHWSEWRRTAVLWTLVIADVPALALLLISPNI